MSEPESHVDIDRQVSEAAANLDQELDDLLGSDETQDDPESSRSSSRYHQIGRAVLVRSGLEVAGAGVDLALMAASGVGISPLRSVANREIIATTGDLVALDKLQKSDAKENVTESKYRRVAKKIGGLVLGIGTAILAQKMGVELADHFNPNLNTGAGEYMVPIVSKVGAIAGVNAAKDRIF